MHLIQGMYQKVPAISDLTQQQLLQLLLLADRYEVPKVQLAVLEAFATMSVNDLEWNIALALLDLPASCADQAGCKQICDLATEKLMQKLGDLEQVWANQQLQELLWSLPHAALLHLLQHDQLCVAHERTVVVTILKWWQKQQLQLDITLLKQLMQQVRMQHLGQLYIGTVMMGSAAIRECFSVPEFGIACMCADPGTLAALQEAKCPELQRYPAWTASRRRLSSKQQMVEWKLPLSELEKAIKQDASGRFNGKLSNQPTVLQGIPVQLKAWVTARAASSGGDCHWLGITLSFRGLPSSGVCRANIELTILATQPYTRILRGRRVVDQTADASFGPSKHAYSAATGWGHKGMVQLGLLIDSWSDIEAVLRAKKLVHDDNCLHVRAKLLHAT